MSRLKSRLDKLDRATLRGLRIPVRYYPKHESSDWLEGVGEFATSHLGVFYPDDGECTAAFLKRVQKESGPPRLPENRTEDELDRAIESWMDLFANAKPAFRQDVQEAVDEFLASKNLN